jgi:hypothetical protein
MKLQECRMVYEFWDMRTNNLIDASDTENDALGALLQTLADQGDHTAEFLILIEDDPELDASRVVGTGCELIDLAATMEHRP